MGHDYSQNGTKPARIGKKTAKKHTYNVFIGDKMTE